MRTVITERESPTGASARSQLRPAAHAGRIGDAGYADQTGHAIRAEALARHFNGTLAVDNVDLRIPAGEIYGFLGPNGAGKSTTVRMLCTLLAPTGGRALVAGYDVASRPGEVRLRIGVALQDAALDPKQTGTELLRLQGRLYGLPSDAVTPRRARLSQPLG